MSTDRLCIDPSTDLRRDPAARTAWRRATTVRVRFSAAAGHVATREGNVRHAAGAAIVTGDRGERWPVEREAFEAGYDPVAPTPMGGDGIYRHKVLPVLARRYDEPFAIALARGRGTLRGEPGDWLVQHGPGSFGVVGASTFCDTYELRD